MRNEMIDFTQCTIEPTKFYDGLNGNKLAIYYENELYILKSESKKEKLKTRKNK